MKETRTLRLMRETLTELGGADLRHVAGGATVRDLCAETTAVCKVTDLTRQADTCQWNGPTFEPDPWQCLTLAPCH